MDDSQDFKSLQDKIQSALVATTRSANALANEDLSFQRTANPSSGARLDATNERLLQLAGDVLKSAGKFAGQAVPTFEDADDVDIGWRGIVDVVDSLLEKADTCLDEYTGLIKRKDVPTAESGRTPKKSKTSDKLDWSLKRANIIKPQKAFERQTDNFDAGPWKPLLTTKPHATVSLEQSLTTTVDEEHQTQYDHPGSFVPSAQNASVTQKAHTGEKPKPDSWRKRRSLAERRLVLHADGTSRYKHPYETEILDAKYPARVRQKAEPIMYLPVETTSVTWVDTYDKVLEMLEELKKADEIAVDLEHHDYRSYPGLLSLMQVSTRDRDWIVDTLQPWRHKLEILNQVFADPNIIKVFHGAYMDIIWLQRDLGLYIVGLFDTHHASDALGYPGKSLAYLLKRFVDFDADKKYQMADWRIRPLPEEMLYYARSDTHYLLYVYDMVRNELVERSASGDYEQSASGDPEQDLVERVIQKSKGVSLQTYGTPTCDVETGQGSRGWFNTLARSPGLLGREQFSVYKAVHKWRDDMARVHDESPAFIMAQHVLADIAKIMPADPKALWALLPRDAQIAKSRLDELLALIGEAKDRGASGPSMVDFFRGDSLGAVAKQVFGDARGQKGKEEQAIPDAKELRSERSQLWGPVPLSSVWDGSNRSQKAAETSEIALPWTMYVQGQTAADVVMAEGNDQVEASEAEAGIPPVHSEVDATTADDEGFTLKAGRKRNIGEVKSDPGSDSELESNPEAELSASELKKVNLDDTGPDAEALAKAKRKEDKRQRKRELQASKTELKAQKAARKAARKAAKAAAGQEAAPNPAGPAEDQAFDYSQAQSVLHAQRATRHKTAPSKVFDPYAAKTGDAPKGARNLNYQKSGKTATFKK